MARIYSMGVGRARGSMGNITYRIVNGETIGSQKQSKGVRLASLAQVLRQVRWGNIVAAYKALSVAGMGRGMYEAFPHRERNQSNFNAFMAANIKSSAVSSVSLTKEKSGSDFVAPAPFIISRGTLGSTESQILPSYGAGGVITFNGNQDFSLFGFVDVLRRLGLDFIQVGDTVTFVSMVWPDVMTPSSEAGVKFFMDQFIVPANDGAVFPDFITADEESGTFSVNIGTGSFNGCYAIVVGRQTANGYDVTNSSFRVADLANSGYDSFITDSQRLLAAESFGYRAAPYLQQNPQ